MASREELRTQLDALQSDFNTMEAENRRLKEDRPEQATALKAEQEGARIAEDNARLTQELGQLRALMHSSIAVYFLSTDHGSDQMVHPSARQGCAE